MGSTASNKAAPYAGERRPVDQPAGEDRADDELQSQVTVQILPQLTPSLPPSKIEPRVCPSPPRGTPFRMKNLRKALAAILVGGLMAGAGACSASGSADKDDGVQINGKVGGDDQGDGY